jgi:hypothetical protein
MTLMPEIRFNKISMKLDVRADADVFVEVDGFYDDMFVVIHIKS